MSSRHTLLLKLTWVIRLAAPGRVRKVCVAGLHQPPALWDGPFLLLPFIAGFVKFLTSKFYQYDGWHVNDRP